MKKDKLALIYDPSNAKDIPSYFKLLKIRDNNRDVKHYAPANKEWKNSVYSFNKESLFSMALKDKNAWETIKFYFSLVPKPIRKTKSKRMRDLLRRSSLRQLLISKPEIKQNTNKATITLYTHDREKVTHLRKLYMLNRWLNCNVLAEKWLPEEKSKSKRLLIKKYNTDYLILEKVFNKHRRIRFRTSRLIIKKGAAKYRIKQRFLSNIGTSFLNKKQFIRTMVFYRFLKWALNFFNIKINIIPDKISKLEKNIIKGKVKDKRELLRLHKLKQLDIVNLVLVLKKNIKVKKESRRTKVKPITVTLKKVKIKGRLNLDIFNKINTLLLHYLLTNFKIINKSNKFTSLFKFFIDKYFNFIVRKSIKKEILIIKNLTKLYVNKFKYNLYIPVLKSVLDNIYSKKIQINLVNLKSIHLNSDIFSEAVSIKLKDRTKSLFRILNKSFGLKTYEPNRTYLMSEKYKNSKMNSIETYFGKFNVINGNVLNNIFKRMFKDRKVSVNRLQGNVKNILAFLKYKKITGIRLEAAGRLTKRYSAARALFKYRYRGPLKNLEHLKNVENRLQSPSLFLLRGNVKPNIQYSFAPSKRRIGAFGIKSWISGS